ncbi:hypothetical protein FT670_08130 [Aeromonas jandaei]|nr:hypothetical protein FT670_08130 [Aeromonas jandaei]
MATASDPAVFVMPVPVPVPVPMPMPMLLIVGGCTVVLAMQGVAPKVGLDIASYARQEAI